jgi:hypothetical protein
LSFAIVVFFLELEAMIGPPSGGLSSAPTTRKPLRLGIGAGHVPPSTHGTKVGRAPLQDVNRLQPRVADASGFMYKHLTG